MELDDTLENYVERLNVFHGRHKRAPGLLIGAYMVEWAMELIGEPEGRLNAVCETRVCLTDAIQVMTGCTIGNKYLHMHDHLGRFAFSLYDRENGEGIRIRLDHSKIDPVKTPELHAFFVRSRDPALLVDREARKAHGEKVMEEFRRVGRGCLSWERVEVNLPPKGEVHPSIVCERCGEPFLRPEGEPDVCRGCRGEGYYKVLEAPAD